jgi:peptidoglycan/xylan/chitin deacetylase (PgdA/CDA1 family)
MQNSNSNTEKKWNKNPFLLQLIGMGATYFVKTPGWLKRIYPRRLWKVDTREKAVYLTFDDGPNPVVTPFVLDELKKYHAGATFFCIGRNVEEHPLLYQRIIQEGHTTGNHTYTHPNGWKTSRDSYLADIAEAAKYIDSNLFRPPYGRIKASQAKGLYHAMGDKPAKIVMWDVLSGDFDENLSAEKCTKNVVKNTREGSIIVFHDSAKAFRILKEVLPATLQFLAREGYVFKSL